MENQSAFGRYWPLLVGIRCKYWKRSEKVGNIFLCGKFDEIPDLSFIFFSFHFISLAVRGSPVLVLFLLMNGRQSSVFLVHNDSLGFLPHLITDSSSRFILEQMPVVVEQKATLKFVPKLNYA